MVSSYNLKHYPLEFPESWASDWGEDPFGLWMAFTYKGIRQVFRWIEAGEFEMGSPEDEPEREDDEISHTVTLTQGFWLADSTVTQALWQAVMNENPSEFTGEKRPVDTVSWDDGHNFIRKMNSLKPELKLCLPTEAQWEYACRSGTLSPFSFGQQINSELVNYNGKYPYNNGKESQYRAETVEVKTFSPNPWGLYEMHGNVLEWCQDWYDSYPDQSVTDPKGSDLGDPRVLRGGSWDDRGWNCRSADRRRRWPGNANGTIGFRLARGH